MPIHKHHLAKALDLNRASFPRAAFDFRFCIFYLSDSRALRNLDDHLDTFLDDRDPWALELPAAGSHSRFFSYLAPLSVWRKRSRPIYGEQSGYLFYHEFIHFLQFLRSGLLNLTVLLTQEFLSDNENLDYPRLISLGDTPPDYEPHDIDFWKKYFLINRRNNLMSGRDIMEADAQLLSIFKGRNTMRYRTYSSTEHPATIHFRDLHKRQPEYARAFIEAEARLGDVAVSLFPLLAYFSLSLPTHTPVTQIQYIDPVDPEDALRAAVDHLEKNSALIIDYVMYVRRFYEQRSASIEARKDPVHNIGEQICKSNGWHYNGPSERKKIIEELGRRNTPTAAQLSQILSLAVDLEMKYGPSIFMEPYNISALKVLTTIPMASMVSVGSPVGGKAMFRTSDFWGKPYVMEAGIQKMIMSLVLSLRFGIQEPNYCPVQQGCPYAHINLCSGFHSYSKKWKQCDFPTLCKMVLGMDLSKLKKV